MRELSRQFTLPGSTTRYSRKVGNATQKGGLTRKAKKQEKGKNEAEEMKEVKRVGRRRR